MRIRTAGFSLSPDVSFKKMPLKLLSRKTTQLFRSLAFLFLLLAASSALAERVEQLQPRGYLNDFAGIVDAESAARITSLAQELDSKTHAQIAVVTIRNLEGSEASDFANRLFKQWGVGDKPHDRGVLVLLAVEDRKYWIEVGYGLEGILPDGKVGGFGREMVQLMRQAQYGPALLLMTSRIGETVAADAGVQLTGALPPAEPPRRVVNISWFPLILFILFFVLPVLSRMAQGGARANGCSGCLLPLLLSGGGGGSRSDWGGFGGGGGGGGGFGGFGGGSSGGGGAGGSW